MRRTHVLEVLNKFQLFRIMIVLYHYTWRFHWDIKSCGKFRDQEEYPEYPVFRPFLFKIDIIVQFHLKTRFSSFLSVFFGINPPKLVFCLNLLNYSKFIRSWVYPHKVVLRYLKKTFKSKFKFSKFGFILVNQRVGAVFGGSDVLQPDDHAR